MRLAPKNKCRFDRTEADPSPIVIHRASFVRYPRHHNIPEKSVVYTEHRKIERRLAKMPWGYDADTLDDAKRLKRILDNARMERRRAHEARELAKRESR